MMAPEPAALPDDVLAEVLRRLTPLALAASRRVCRAWRDARLRGHLLSRSVRGIFINYTAHRNHFWEFFSRPSMGTAICGGLGFLPCNGVKVADHCNGLAPALRRSGARLRGQPGHTAVGASSPTPSADRRTCRGSARAPTWRLTPACRRTMRFS
ncbi:hypothetical protein ACQ4PT_018391 [Festuca glaucescens]